MQHCRALKDVFLNFAKSLGDAVMEPQQTVLGLDRALEPVVRRPVAAKASPLAQWKMS